MNILYCDPSQNQQVYLWFGTRPQRQITLISPRAGDLLSALHKLVRQDKIEQLVLVNQATSFTLLRIIITIFNTLAFTQHIPLHSLAVPQTDLAKLETWLTQAVDERQLVPHYNSAPNIV